MWEIQISQNYDNSDMSVIPTCQNMSDMLEIPVYLKVEIPLEILIHQKL